MSEQAGSVSGGTAGGQIKTLAVRMSEDLRMQLDIIAQLRVAAQRRRFASPWSTGLIGASPTPRCSARPRRSEPRSSERRSRVAMPSRPSSPQRALTRVPVPPLPHVRRAVARSRATTDL